MERAWDEEKECFMASLKDEKNETERYLDASVLLLARLKFIDPNDEKFVKTVRVGNIFPKFFENLIRLENRSGVG
ncbi:hypothetical protein MHBO_004410 [Bonamia ostreae]